MLLSTPRRVPVFHSRHTLNAEIFVTLYPRLAIERHESVTKIANAENATLRRFDNMSLVFGAKVSLARILILTVHQSANVRKTAIDFFPATRIIALRLDTVSDLASAAIGPAMSPSHDIYSLVSYRFYIPIGHKSMPATTVQIRSLY